MVWLPALRQLQGTASLDPRAINRRRASGAGHSTLDDDPIEEPSPVCPTTPRAAAADRAKRLENNGWVNFRVSHVPVPSTANSTPLGLLEKCSPEDLSCQGIRPTRHPDRPGTKPGHLGTYLGKAQPSEREFSEPTRGGGTSNMAGGAGEAQRCGHSGGEHEIT